MPTMQERNSPQGIPFLPDPKITPGATLPVTRDDICVSGYSGKVRNVPSSVKNQAYAAYRIPTHRPGEYEVDHLISLELGGSNSVKNLWPQSYLSQPWNAHVKDALENRLHADVCSNRIDLATAQHEIATDWIAVYKRLFHTDKPLGGKGRSRGRVKTASYVNAPATIQDAMPPSSMAPTSDGQVWVNTNSGKYFYPNMRYYGKTKQGEYLTEAQARQQGFTLAK